MLPREAIVDSSHAAGHLMLIKKVHEQRSILTLAMAHHLGDLRGAGASAEEDALKADEPRDGVAQHGMVRAVWLPLRSPNCLCIDGQMDRARPASRRRPRSHARVQLHWCDYTSITASGRTVPAASIPFDVNADHRSLLLPGRCLVMRSQTAHETVRGRGICVRAKAK